MSDITTTADLRPLVGSPNFIAALLAYIRNSSSGSLPLDPVILQSILLCMIAGQKNLILHTPEEDVTLVVKLVVWTLSSVFDLPIHKVKIKPRAPLIVRGKVVAPPRNPNVFLRSLFLPSSRHDPFDQSRPSSRAKTRSGKRRTGLRSVSFPNDLSVLGKSDIAETAGDSMELKPREVNEASKPSLIIKAPQPRPFFHAHTEPVALRRDVSDPEFPRALVLSGLEHTSYAEQTALTRVLTERQVVLEAAAVEHDTSSTGRRRRQASTYTQDSDTNPSSYNVPSENLNYEGTWNVPDDFIMIYVCPWDPRERPKINKSLLDHFAMSSTIVVQEHVRQALSAFPFATNASSHSRHHSHSHSNPTTPSPLQSPPLPYTRTPSVMSRPTSNQLHNSFRSSHSLSSPIVPKQLLPREFIVYLRSVAESAHFSHNLSLYLSDLFSATRHHPNLDGTFLTARSMNDAYALARAGRVLGTDPTGGELLRGFPGTDSLTTEDDLDMERTESFHDYEDIASGSGSVTINIMQEGKHSRSLIGLVENDQQHKTSKESVQEEPPENLYVTEADIARIVPRVVTHRLRVRDGPEDEVLAGAVFGATFQPRDDHPASVDITSGQYHDTRRTIKDILVQILAEV